MTKLIAIIGATGNQGGSVLKTFHASGEYRIRAITRNPDSDTVKSLAKTYPGVEWVQADLDDPASLSKAFDGADVVFGMTNARDPSIIQRVGDGEADAEYKLGKNIVDAAIAANVDSLVYSGIYSIKEESGGKYAGAVHFESKNNVEKYLLSKADQIKGFIVRLGCFMQNFTRFSRISSEDNKTVEFLFATSPTTKLPYVDANNDVGPVVKYALDHPDECLGVPQEISGGYYEAQEIARAYTEVTGKPARYVQLPYEFSGLESMKHMFKSFDEFGYFSYRTDFIERSKKIDHKFKTPTEFWKSINWDGPAK